MKRAHNNNFNLLRLIFAIAVIFSHSFQLLRQPDPFEAWFGAESLGRTGVFGFFMLSGYLTAQSWTSEPRALPFLKKRALRLYPAFIVASAVSVFFVGPIATSVPDYFGEWEMHKFLSDLVGLRQPRTPAVFEGSPVPSVNGSMWTITFELRCYLLLALLGTVGVVRRRTLMLALAMAMTIIAAATAPAVHDAEGDALFGVSGYMIWFATIYLCGACFYLFRARVPMTPSLALPAAAIFAASLVWAHPLARPAMLIAGGYTLIYLAQMRSTLLTRLRMDDDLSYGIYLYGWPITQLIAWRFPSIAPLLMFATVLSLSTGLAFVSWRLIEQPMLRFKRRIPERVAPMTQR